MDDFAESNAPEVKTYSTFAGFAFTVNYIIGVGVLALPGAFYAAGWALSVIMLVCMTAICYISMVWLIEVIARREGLRLTGDEEREPLMAAINSETFAMNNTDKMVISMRKYEINELCTYFLGSFGQRVYEVCVGAYLFGCLWGFTSIFGTTAADVIPFPGLSDSTWPCGFYGSTLSTECFHSYQVFVAFFSAFVIPLSLMDLADQAVIQIILCLYRFLSFFVMVFTTLAFMFQQPYKSLNCLPNPDNLPTPTPFVNYTIPYPCSTRLEPPYVADGIKEFDFSGFGIIFPAIVFAQLTHHSVPGIIQPVRNKNHLKGIFLATLTVSTIFYAVMGTILASYLGAGIKDLATLNWQLPIDAQEVGVGEYILRYAVILLPVFLALSAFPITAVTLGNNLYAGLPATWTKNQTSKGVRTICRLVAVLPPLILGAFIFELATVVTFTGLFGVFLAFLFPAILQYFSVKRVIQVYGENIPTPYSGFHSGNFWVAFVFLFGIASLVLMVSVIVDPTLFESV